MIRAAFALLALFVLSMSSGVYSQQQLIEDEPQFKDDGVSWDDFIIYPYNKGVNLGELVDFQFQYHGIDRKKETYNCHGYAWLIAGCFPNIYNNYELMNEELINFFDSINLNDFECEPSEATHIVWWGNVIGEYAPQHSAIVSRYQAFPFSDGWVLSANGVLPPVILHKIEDFMPECGFDIKYYNMYPDNNYPETWFYSFPPQPTFYYAQNIGNISGPSTIPTGQPYHIFQVDPCDDLAYNCDEIDFYWAAYDLRNKPYKVLPMEIPVVLVFQIPERIFWNLPFQSRGMNSPIIKK